MRNVGAHLLDDKMDEAVTQYINSHQANEHPVHVNSNTLALNVQDDGGGRVTVMHTQSFTSPLCRQVSVGEQVGDGPWGEELLDSESRIAAIVAQLAQHSRASHHHQPTHHKMTSVRSDVDPSVILDGSMRLLGGQTIDQHHHEQIVVHVPHLAPLPPLQDMKRCPDTDWFSNKSRSVPPLKDDTEILEDSQSPDLELGACRSPSQNKQQSKKSLPHKKRISKKLKKNGIGPSQQDIVVINCTEDVHHEEILPDNFVTGVQHQEQLPEDTHHITHEIRPILLCQLCGEFYGEEQLKFYHHLKQHYEPHSTIIIENPVPDLAIDKMTNTCIVDNVATLPDSIVELSLENTVPKTMYQNIDKHILYTQTDKTLNYTNNRGVQYSMEKETPPPTDADKTDLYESLDRMEVYSCMKCNKSFRRQKHCELHIKEAHPNAKFEDMGEFSEPEDLMEGIHVSVEDGGDQYDNAMLPHLTVENGQVHQEHVRNWYIRGNGNSGQMCTADGAFVAVCPASTSASVPAQQSVQHAPVQHASVQHASVQHASVQHASVQHASVQHASVQHASVQHASVQHARQQPHDSQPLKILKEEVLHRILETDVPADQIMTDNMMPNSKHLPEHELTADDPKEEKKKQAKKYECPQCVRVFRHRSSLLYHVLSHGTKQQVCRECGKSFYTTAALKIHKRVHNGDRPYKCDVCGRDFRQWSDLKYHKVIHTNQKRFKCDFCGKEFARKYSLNVHRRIHTGERNYKCEYCNKSFSASSYRLTHMRTHTGDKPHKCDQCDKSFRVAFDLRRHILTHEKARLRFEQQLPKVKEENEPEADNADDIKKQSPKIKKIALASTTKPPTEVKVDKKPIKKGGKKGAPNVTVGQTNGQFKVNDDYSINVEAFDAKQDCYGKFKEVYSETPDFNKHIDFKTHVVYKDHSDKDFATLKPMLRSNILDDPNRQVYSKTENTDGKMQIFTHVVKNKEYHSPIVPNTQALGDVRHLERDVVREVRSDINGEVIDNVFFERLNPFYNIPAV